MFCSEHFICINDEGCLIKLKIFSVSVDIFKTNDQIVQELLAALFTPIKKYILCDDREPVEDGIISSKNRIIIFRILRLHV